MGFRTTRWSLVLAAGRSGTPGARRALEELCETYWFPLYAWARREGRDRDAAQDAVQGFFARLLEREGIRAASPGRGRFRSFLLTAFRNFLRNEAAHAAALKRGGGVRPVSFDCADAEGRMRIEPAHGATPERLYLRDWAVAVLDRVLAELRRVHEESGTLERFEALKGCLAGEDASAAALGMTEGARRVAVHRLRAQYRDLLREEIAQTLDEGEDVEAEIADLFRALESV